MTSKMPDKFSVSLKEDSGPSPKINKNFKAGQPRDNYYRDLEASDVLRQKQSLNDPLKEFYKLKENMRQDKEKAESDSDDYENELFTGFVREEIPDDEDGDQSLPQFQVKQSRSGASQSNNFI